MTFETDLTPASAMTALALHLPTMGADIKGALR
jgi:hypothetical protein